MVNLLLFFFSCPYSIVPLHVLRYSTSGKVVLALRMAPQFNRVCQIFCSTSQFFTQFHPLGPEYFARRRGAPPFVVDIRRGCSEGVEDTSCEALCGSARTLPIRNILFIFLPFTQFPDSGAFAYCHPAMHVIYQCRCR